MKLIPIGRVLAAHGVKGEVKFGYYNDDGSSDLGYRRFIVSTGTATTDLTALQVRRQGGSFIIKFKGIDSIEAAQFLLKQELSVAESDLPRLEEDEYYDYQLIGLGVQTEEGDSIGKVREIMHTGAHDILVIYGQTETLIPMTEDHIMQIDVRSGVIRVRRSELTG